ncbi:hypothetical protein Tco_0442434 [Tanacetum coccineum]
MNFIEVNLYWNKIVLFNILPQVSAAEIYVVEKERMTSFHFLLWPSQGTYEKDFQVWTIAKEIWEAIRTNLVVLTTPSTSSNNIPEREVPASFADEIDDVDIEEMDINWQIAMIAFQIKKFYKKTGGGMTSNSKVGLGYEIQSNNEVLSYEEEMNRTVFKCTEEDFLNKPLYNRFSKTDNFKGVPHPLTRDYIPKPQEEIDDYLYVYGKKGPQKPEISDSDDNSTKHSTCQSNDNEGSFGNPSEHSFESESESISVPNEMSTSKSVITNEKVVFE